jgi:hypothetical protein
MDPPCNFAVELSHIAGPRGEVIYLGIYQLVLLDKDKAGECNVFSGRSRHTCEKRTLQVASS